MAEALSVYDEAFAALKDGVRVCSEALSKIVRLKPEYPNVGWKELHDLLLEKGELHHIPKTPNRIEHICPYDEAWHG